MVWNMDLKQKGWVQVLRRTTPYWNVYAYAMLEVIAGMEASNWCARLFLKCHSMDQLKAMDSDISVKDLLRDGHKNITIDQHNEKPDRTKQSKRKGASQQLFGIERQRIRGKKGAGNGRQT